MLTSHQRQLARAAIRGHRAAALALPTVDVPAGHRVYRVDGRWLTSPLPIRDIVAAHPGATVHSPLPADQALRLHVTTDQRVETVNPYGRLIRTGSDPGSDSFTSRTIQG